MARKLTLQDAIRHIGPEETIYVLPEPIKVKWKLSYGDWYWQVVKYVSPKGVCFDEVQDGTYEWCNPCGNTEIIFPDGTHWVNKESCLDWTCQELPVVFRNYVEPHDLETFGEDDLLDI